MDYTGLYAKKYRVNRKLTEEERSNQLHQKAALNVTPLYNLSVIKINSTYLESVDRWFLYRGTMTVICLLGIALPFVIFFIPLLVMPSIDWMAIFTLVPISAPLWVLATWGLLKESFRRTHFPIRFNYRNRMVYVFKTNGTVFQAKWDDIFFTLGRCERMVGIQNWDIRGHVLDKDRETILETFALPGDDTNIDQLKQAWEFFRRHMEDGPATIYRDVYWCHDIAERREKFKAGLTTMLFSFNGHPIAQILSYPFFFFEALGRWFAMRTSKIPAWPAEVEAQCKVDPFDPNLRDASHNPDKIPMEPIKNE
ncbi:MAG TPA: DUF6708 domain-containing protein [Pirellulales bacterium]|jgi:hypothetical protein